MDWKTFWDRPNAIYVNARHEAAHYRGIADDLIGLIEAPSARLLDHGCGHALDAARVAAACAHLSLLDAAPSVRSGLRERLSGVSNVTILAPEDLPAAPDGAFDLIVANSLLQYLSREEFAACLALWRRTLAPGGRLVLADVIPPGVSALTDARALLSFAAREGFLPAAIAGLVRTALSDYRRIRATLGLATYSQAEMVALLDAAGFAGERAPRNLGHNPARQTFIARARS